MTTLEEIKQRLMRDPEFVSEYEKADAEYKSVEATLSDHGGKITAMKKLVEDGRANGIGTR